MHRLWPCTSAWLAALAAGMFLAACAPATPGSQPGSPGAPPAGSQPAATQPEAASSIREAPLRKVRLAYSAISVYQVIPLIAQSAGLFQKNGIEAEISSLGGGGARAITTLIAGEVDFVQAAGDGAILAGLSGAEPVMVLGFVNTLVQSLVVSPSLGPSNLAGKRLGITRRGSLTDFSLHYSLRKLGLDPDKEVDIVQMNDVPGILVGMESGAIDGGMLSPPTLSQAKSRGYRELMDLTKTDLQYPSTALVTTWSYIDSHPDIVQDVVRALVQAFTYYRANESFSLGVLREMTKQEDQELLRESYAAGLAAFPEKPYPPLNGARTALEQMAAAGNPEAAAADPRRFVDERFVARALEGGPLR